MRPIYLSAFLCGFLVSCSETKSSISASSHSQRAKVAYSVPEMEHVSVGFPKGSVRVSSLVKQAQAYLSKKDKLFKIEEYPMASVEVYPGNPDAPVVVLFSRGIGERFWEVRFDSVGEPSVYFTGNLKG